MTSEVYVYLHMLSESPVLAGRLVVKDDIGQFVYGRSYRERPWAFPLDPINLPLVSGTRVVRVNKGIPGALLDAGPDRWGERLMRVVFGRSPKTPLDLLLYSNGQGVGQLLFSRSRDGVKEVKRTNTIENLALLDAVISDIERGRDAPAELIRLLAPGSSFGGARPKTAVRDGGKDWVAKFNRPDDLFDQVIAEYATMQLAADLGLRVPAVRLVPIGNQGRHCILVERFDRTPEGERFHVVSTWSLTGRDRVRPEDMRGICSYDGIRRILNRVSVKGDEDARELYRRMVLNILCGNTDDHMKNHAVVHRPGEGFRLSPAYDIVPQGEAGGGVQAIGVGPQGRAIDKNGLIAEAEKYGIEDGAAVVEEIAEAVRSLPERLRAAGMASAEIDMLARGMPALQGDYVGAHSRKRLATVLGRPAP